MAEYYIFLPNHPEAGVAVNESIFDARFFDFIHGKIRNLDLDEFENLAAAVRVCVLGEAIRKIRYTVITELSRLEALICFEIQFENLL